MRALRFAGAVALASAALALPASGGCGGDAFTAGGNDGGGNGDGQQGESGSSSGGSRDGMGDEGSDGPSMQPGKTVYVSPKGSDMNSGLDTLHPVRSIKHAVDVAQGLADGGISLPSIIVCSGNYPEDSLHVGFDMTLSGAFDCSTNPQSWTRATGYGWPTFDPTVASVVTFANTTSQEATLAVLGGVTSKTVIDGFTIDGGSTVSSAPTPSIGVEVGLGARPMLSNLVIDGGAGSAGSTDAGSIGLRVTDGSPEIADCVIDGGRGEGPSGTGFGSIGLRLVEGSPNVHDDIVLGGSGSSTSTSSVGIDVETSQTILGGNPLSGVIVAGADGGANPTGATVGVLVPTGVTADVDLEDSIVYGTLTDSGTAVSTAVELSSGGKYSLVADRIVCGGMTQGRCLGVSVTASSDFSLVNSEVHAGDVPTSATGTTRGVDLAGTIAKAAIVFDTIYTGADGGQSGTAAIDLEAGATNVTIESDLLLGSGVTGVAGGAGAAVIATTCTGAGKQIASLDHTGFVNFTDLLYCADTGQTNALPTGVTVSLDGSTTCATTCGDVIVTSTCATPTQDCQADMQCPATMPPDACLQSVLGTSWPSLNDGVGAIDADAGTDTFAWQIQPPGDYCKLTRGAKYDATVPEDLLGNKRSTTTPTMGAVEFTGSSCSM